ncbi:hypothetical protein K488DRAFT_81833 [Vararia minispora EC-137]|uniref:Uncharacterized protein n=1 Tax=Vararia minispora EC-137 TaxID=1314806 RepID=A0ACB8QZ40_9AGAM|nr:hypothetical protein K488DRAFT_81833 [Vararia minispora EC-137]
MSVDGGHVAEDASPAKDKLALVPGGFVVHDVAGIRTRVTTRLDGRGYDITKLGPYTVRTGQLVYMKDAALLTTIRASSPPDDRILSRTPDIAADFRIVNSDTLTDHPLCITVTAQTALFSGDPGAPRAHELLRAASPDGVMVVHDKNNVYGCEDYTYSFGDYTPGAVVLARRGECTLLDKLRHAWVADAAGVVVISSKDDRIQPSAEPEDLALAGAIDDVIALSLTQSEGATVSKMVELVNSVGTWRVIMTLQPQRQEEIEVKLEGESRSERKGASRDAGVLHINGYPLVNTRLGF